MKSTLLKITFFVFCLSFYLTNGQTTNTLPFYDNMNYTVGEDLFPSSTNQSTFGNWYTLDPRSSPVQTIVASPTWALSSNVVTASGNALSTSTFGEDPELFFDPHTSGEIFVSMFIQMGSSFSSNLNSVNLDRIFEIAEAGTGQSSAAAAVFARGVVDNGTVIGIEFGINEDGSATDATDVNWSGITHSANEQLFLVFSYTIDSSDTTAKLWINPVVNGTEPAVTAEDTTDNVESPIRFSFNVRGSEYTPSMITDEFRIGNSWNDVAPVQGGIAGSGAVDSNITTATTPTFPVYESFDNYVTGAKLIDEGAETGIGAWGTKDARTPTSIEVIDAPTWSSVGTDIGVNNSGKAMEFGAGSGEDGYVQFTKTSGSFGTIYASFLMRITDITNIDTDTYRLVGFGRKNETSVSGATHLYVKKDDSDGTKYNIGVNESNSSSSSAIPTYVGGNSDPTEYAVDEDLFVVLYFDDATDGDGITAKLWINPVITGSEPTPSATDSTDRNLDVDVLIFTLSNSVRTPGAIFDEIRIASTWDEVTKVKHTWTGATSDWATNTNWDNNIVPSALSNVDIPSGASNQPVIGATTGVAVHNITVDPAATLSITSGGALQSTGTVSGDITYNLNIPDDEWHFVSSPVVGEEYNDTWVSANGIASGQGNNRGVSWYDNSSLDGTTGYWRYMQQGDNGVFQGRGYGLKRTGSGTYAFTGTFPRANFEIPISQSNGNNWNLVNNPYPSYISVADLVTANSANLGGLFQAIYIWNPSSGSNGAYEILTSGHIHPGQAFFVNSNVASGTLDITESLQSAQTGVTFYKNTSPSITLSVVSGEKRASTSFSFTEDSSLGLDLGKDFGAFTGENVVFTMFSNLVEENTGIPVAKQSLPLQNITEIVLPIGVIAKTNDELKFKTETINLPNDAFVILEDRLTNTFTDLTDAGTDYSVKLTEDLNGVGRFFIHTSSSVLSAEAFNNTSKLSVYQTGNQLKISGIQDGQFTKVSLYNVLGQEVLSHSYTSRNNTKEINLPKINTGVYIVNIKSEKEEISKKIIIK